ncbi:hypothetical protein OHB12_12200 [Nocardia sp. NBC_01730]|uniref:hypothetical protein n=1 Tax=Nocardia sp. NBC_01730 TaxID=2975998 RepID=UPI002E0FB99C|nr:hypothetical protein OHB12_12200 [Nocardia sp. NBC_01730]
MTDDADLDGGIGWQWINLQPPPPPQPTTRSGHTRVPRRVWVGLAAGLGVAAVVIGAGISSVTDRPDTATPIPTLTASPQTITPSSGGACAGLSGQTVTDTAGDTHSLVGVIAAFEHAYYVQRSGEAALRLVAPEAGLNLEALSAGIASSATGTTHCVAITPIAEGAAEVHLVERHPGGQRIDYLQLINIRHDLGNVVITNIQKRG